MIDYSKMVTADDKVEAAKDAARTIRDMYLNQSDWVVTRSHEIGDPVPEVWSSYRQSLRDVPEQEGFPFDIVWPEKPDFI